MTIKLNSLAADLKKEAEGEWIEIHRWPGVGDTPGLRFRVRSLQFDGYVEAVQAETEKLSQKYKGKSVPRPEINRAMGAVIADHILLEWDGLDEPYDRSTAKQMLTSAEHRVLREMVVDCASRVAALEVKFVEEAAKNSEPPSATS